MTFIPPRPRIEYDMDRLEQRGYQRKLSAWEIHVLDTLEEYGLEPYVYCTASTGSMYIRFANAYLGSLRVGDHPGRKQYNYRWELRADLRQPKRIPGKWTQWKFPNHMLDDLCMCIASYTWFNKTEIDVAPVSDAS